MNGRSLIAMHFRIGLSTCPKEKREEVSDKWSSGSDIDISRSTKWYDEYIDTRKLFSTPLPNVRVM